MMTLESTPAPSIAILGGSGFIGTRLVERMLQLSMNPRIGDLRVSEVFPDRHVPCDVRKAETLKEVLSGVSTLINLAAEHRDDVRPLSRYHETNVEGARQVCLAAESAGVQKIIFTSSVAVYGFHSFPVDENGPFVPFNPYGETKLQAEEIYREWAAAASGRTLVIARPTVVFGEKNRGNVYNLLRQIASGHFKIVGPGTNKKSMAYVGNTADVLIFSLTLGEGTHIFNYADTPDYDMNGLVRQIYQGLGRRYEEVPKIPLPVALFIGRCFDLAAVLTRKTFPISAIRVQKFCANTQFNAAKIKGMGFTPRYSIEEGLERTIQCEFQRE